MKKIISLSEYESLYEHLERSEAWIAVDARDATYGDIRAIFLGESWGRLKAIYDSDTYDFRLYYHGLPALWREFFSDPLPNYHFSGSGINFNEVNVTIQRIARKILDAVYDIEDDNE